MDFIISKRQINNNKFLIKVTHPLYPPPFDKGGGIRRKRGEAPLRLPSRGGRLEIKPSWAGGWEKELN
jgi:hypothetical protein